jgi:hypothetical protein
MLIAHREIGAVRSVEIAHCGHAGFKCLPSVLLRKEHGDRDRPRRLAQDG